MTDGEQLRRKLCEDAGTPEEAEAVLPAARRLAEAPAPRVTPAETARLLAALQPALPRPAARGTRLRWAWLLLRSQLRVVHAEIWTGSALVMALGALVTLANAGGDPRAEAQPLALIAPLVVAFGVAFLYGPAHDPALEIELAAPASPRLVLLARLTLLFVFDLALGLLGSAALAALRADVSLWPLVSAWLAPMACLSALAFLLSVLCAEPLIGASASLFLWGLYATRIALPAVTESRLLALLDPAAPAARPWLWLAAAVMLALAVWLAGHEERWLGRETA